MLKKGIKKKMKTIIESEAKLSVEFVLNVLRQHEIEFDRFIGELEVLVLRVNELSDKIQRKVT